MRRRLALVALVALVAVPSASASWPLRPVDRQHAVRAGMLDLRFTGDERVWAFHEGLDVVVDERRRARKAPRGGVKRVFAVGPGRVRDRSRARRPGESWTGCGFVQAGRWGYGHVIPAVRRGKRLREGDFLGWSCRKHWHVHITWWSADRTVRLDPLMSRRLPSVDVWAPTIEGHAYDPVTGALDVRVEDVHEPPRLAPWQMLDRIGPAGIAVNGAVLWEAKRGPFDRAIVGPQTRRNEKAPAAGLAVLAGDLSFVGPGERWWRVGYFPEGGAVTVAAWDRAGNRAEAVIELEVSPQPEGGNE